MNRASLVGYSPGGLQSTRLLRPWNFPDKNTGVGSHSLLQRIFLTQASNPCLLNWQVDSLPLASPGKANVFKCMHICECGGFTYPLVSLSTFRFRSQSNNPLLFYLSVHRKILSLCVITLDFNLLGDSPKSSVLCVIKHFTDSQHYSIEYVLQANLAFI